MRAHFRTVAFPLVGMLLFPLAYAVPLVARAAAEPVITEDFPDPAIINVDNVWYGFGTQGNGNKVQIAQSQPNDLRNWTLLDQDALPVVGEWSTGAAIWAPHVLRINDGSFVLYYSAVVPQQGPSNQTLHCVGAATSNNVTGPYQPAVDAIACPTDMGGAIDISTYVDEDGTIVVLYKVDGNSIGYRKRDGDVLGDLSTPIMMQQMEADGITPVGEPVVVLDRDAGDGTLIEAPSLMRDTAGTFFLTFSSNAYDSDLYDTSYATSDSLWGPYTKTSEPLLTSQLTGLVGPGGAEFDRSGQVLAYHAILERRMDATGFVTYLRRGMFIADVATNDTTLEKTIDW